MLLDYTTMIGSNYIVFALPENCFNPERKQPIWGSHNSSVSGEEYILPEYILGVVPEMPFTKDRTEYDLSKKVFLPNDCNNREVYEYFYENGVDYTKEKRKY